MTESKLVVIFWTRVIPTIKTTRLCDLIRMILTSNTFTFNGQHYRQINGTAIGTKMAPFYANLFMGNFDRKVLAAATHSPLIWWCYIDDIFLLWIHGEEKLNDFITLLRQPASYHLSLPVRKEPHLTLSSLLTSKKVYGIASPALLLTSCTWYNAPNAGSNT